MDSDQEEQPDFEARIALMEALEFNTEDIIANRQGELTERQRELLQKERHYWLVYELLILPVVPPLVAWTIIDGIDRHDTAASRVGIMALIFILTSTYYWYVDSKRQRAYQDILGRRVFLVAGTAKLRKYCTRQGIQYEVWVERMKFKITGRIFDAFQPNGVYCIYYAEHSKIIMSAEPCALDSA